MNPEQHATDPLEQRCRDAALFGTCLAGRTRTFLAPTWLPVYRVVNKWVIKQESMGNKKV
jgi:hypothetical protein